MKMFVLVPCVVVALAQVALSNVIVVAPSGGDFTQIQQAVDAALDGDTVLIKTGNYATFSVVNKAISIVGDTGADVHVAGAVRARNLAADKTLVLANLEAVGAFSGNPATQFGLYLTNNAGHVRVESCEFTGQGPLPNNDGVRIENCADVSLTLCVSHGFMGPNGSVSGSKGGAGLKATASTVTCYDAQFFGGVGQPGNGGSGGSGGDGCHATDCELFASGSLFIGGNGGAAGSDGLCSTCADGGNGGSGTILAGASLDRLLACTEQAGTGGAKHPAECCSKNGANGSVRGGATFEDLDGPARHMLSPTPVREMTTTTIDFTGVPGEEVTLLLTRTTGHLYVASESGVELLGSPLRIIPMGTVPASGVLTKNLSIFSVGSVPSVRIYLQALFTDPSMNTVLSGPGTMVVLNQLF